MNIKRLISIFFIFSTTFVWGQHLTNYANVERKLNRVLTQYEDSLKQLITEKTQSETTDDLELNSRYYRLFCPPTFYASPSSKMLTMGDEKRELYVSADSLQLFADNEHKIGYQNQNLEKEIDNALLNIYMQHPDYVSYTESEIMSDIATSSVVSEMKPTAEILPEIVSSEAIVEKLVGTELVVKKPNFWKFNGNASMQFTQNYISGNWAEGGESTNTLISRLILEADYDDKQRIKFENELDVHLGFTTAPSDTLHKYRTNTDVIRITSKLGVKAVNSWYYTIQMTANTQLLRNYKVNSNTLQSAFFAPMKLNFSVGMDYNKGYKNGNISVNLAPLAYQLTYVGNKDVDETRYGVKRGKRSLNNYGSQMTVTNKWNIYKNISWNTKLFAFTNYHKVEASWENTFDFAMSKYLSTKLFLHGRFNDGIKRKPGYTYFQFKELLSFGLSYKW